MPTLFHQRFEERVEPANKRAFGVTVKLQSGADSSAEFTAVFDMQEHDSVELETGLPIKITSRDYLLKKTDCLIDGVQVVPLRGMFIVEGGVRYEILPLPGRPAVELQPGEYRYLCHTKETSISETC